TITGTGIINFMWGGDGDDTITGGNWLDMVIAKKGNDTINVSNSFFAYVEGGEGDDKITGPSNEFALGSIIIGDDMQIAKSLNLLESLKSGFTIESKAFSVKLGIGFLQFNGTGNDTITVNGGIFTAVVGGMGDDNISVGGRYNLVIGDEFNVGASLDWK